MNTKSNKVLSIYLLFAIILPIQAEKINIRIGVLYWSMNIPGQVAMRSGLEKQIISINKSDAKYFFEIFPFVAGDGNEGMERQIQQMYYLIKKNVDMIIVQPTDIAALSMPLKAANKKEIPVVAYDQHILGGDLSSFITSNNYQAGFLDGEYVAANFPAEKKLKVILIEYPHVSSTVSRVDGFIDALEQYKQNYEIVKTYNAVEPVSGEKAGYSILQDFPEKNSIDVIFAINDGGGLKASQVIEDAGRDEIFFATVDGDPESVSRIKKGSIIRIDSAQFCAEMGAEAARVAVRIIKGQKVAKEILIPVFPITKETLNLYKGWYSSIPDSFIKSWHSSEKEWSSLITSKKE